MPLARVIGNGLLGYSLVQASFKLSSQYTILASGVSNSRETRASQFLREKLLVTRLMDEYPDTPLVYFSSNALCSPDLPVSPYFEHKFAMEYLIMKHPSSVIFRLPQVVGPVSNKTLIPYLVRSLLTSAPININTKARRRLLSVADITRIVYLALSSVPLPSGPVLYSICPKYDISVSEIVSILVDQLGVLAPEIYLVDSGYAEPYNESLLPHCVLASDVILTQGYQEHVLRHYAPLIASH